MKSVFADTYYYLALLNPSDDAHSRAVLLTDRQSARLVTSEYVLIEVADALAHPRSRSRFLGLLDALRLDPTVTIVRAGEDLFERGLSLYRRRPDKDWSLTDCLSFVVIQDEGAAEVLTADHHFAQADFVVLFAES